ncbi:MAG: 50S ribosomal protein L15 [Candidatus Paceibacterota bacterium]|jgi:large subunit ribosomal protein L15
MKRMTVGRGGKRGKTSGRGTKGQKARAGHKIRPEIRDMIKRLPKLRGYAFKSPNDVPVCPVNLSAIESAFKAGETVSSQTLVAKGIVSLFKGKQPVIKILSSGEIAKKINFVGCAVSASAKAKIEKVGGTVK